MNRMEIGMMSKAMWCAAILAISPVVVGAQTAPGVNPVYVRAQTLVNDGNATAGRALVDSMIAIAAPGSNEYAEGVYWRAVLAGTAADAEMDYRRVVIDFPNSPRVEDALIRLAQLEIARANYDGALKHLARFASEHPDSPGRARASYWTARALFDKNDVQGGCSATADALARTSENDTELKNQITYLNQRCAGISLTSPVATTAPAPTTAPTTAPPPASVPVTVPAPVQSAPPVDSATVVAKITVPEKVPETVKPPVKEPVSAPASPSERVFSVQVAAYNVKSQAEAMVAKLKKSGYEARVDGTSAPFRVRIGKYASQTQANAVQRSLKAKQITGFVVQADIR
jgi:cell division septation protein DedD